MDLEKVLDTSQATDAKNEEADLIDLSEQIQVINLGYLGQDSNLFELAQNYVDFSFIPLF
jgi:dynein heavy chain 1, cytosolic